MKHMAKKGKMHIKKWDLRVKKGGFGIEKNTIWMPSRKAKWCKMHAKRLNLD